MRKKLISLVVLIFWIAVLLSAIGFRILRPDIGETGAFIIKIVGGLIIAYSLFKDIRRFINRTVYLKPNIINLALSILLIPLYIYYVYTVSVIGVIRMLAVGMMGAIFFVKAMIDLVGVYLYAEDKEDQDKTE